MKAHILNAGYYKLSYKKKGLGATPLLAAAPGGRNNYVSQSYG